LPIICTRLILLCHLPLEVHFLLGRHLLVCPLHVPLMLCQEASKEVMAILMGAFLSALSSIWLFSNHGVGILTSSTPPSANYSCRMCPFTTFSIFDKGTLFHQSSISSSLFACHLTFSSRSFTMRSRMGSGALHLRCYSTRLCLPFSISAASSVCLLISAALNMFV
jgi:hypothetical protein